MPQVTIVTLLAQRNFPGPVGSAYTWVGDPQKAAAYYLANRDLQTISWSTGDGGHTPSATFSGNITIQASLATTPGAHDWFDVYNIPTSDEQGYHNLNGNYIWLRARVTDWTQGVINVVRASY